jgi:hypothetical protein
LQVMKYMTDANNAGLAKQLREKGVDCETVHKLMLGSEDSRIQILDPAIVKFLLGKKGEITLITFDNELAEYCKEFGVPCIGPLDAVLSEIKARAK